MQNGLMFLLVIIFAIIGYTELKKESYKHQREVILLFLQKRIALLQEEENK